MRNPAAVALLQLVAGPLVQMIARLLHYEQEGAELQLRPLRLLPAAEAANCNILELVGATATPVPPNLPAAVNVAGGALSCTLAISLPGGATTLVAAGGSIKEAGVTWGNSPRLFLSPALVQQLKVCPWRCARQPLCAVGIVHHSLECAACVP